MFVYARVPLETEINNKHEHSLCMHITSYWPIKCTKTTVLLRNRCFAERASGLGTTDTPYSWSSHRSRTPQMRVLARIRNPIRKTPHTLAFGIMISRFIIDARGQTHNVLCHPHLECAHSHKPAKVFRQPHWCWCCCQSRRSCYPLKLCARVCVCVHTSTHKAGAVTHTYLKRYIFDKIQKLARQVWVVAFFACCVSLPSDMVCAHKIFK